MTNDALNQIAATYGSLPLATGAQTVELPCTAFEADEDTTFGSFYDSVTGTELMFHPWKGKTLTAGKIAFLGQSVGSFSITAGGLGQAYLSGSEQPVPDLLTKSTNAAGTLIVLTFDRTMYDPSARLADFSATTNGAANALTAAALGANEKTIELTVTDAIVFLDSVTVSMAYGNIFSKYGAKALPIAAAVVTNIVPE